MNMPLKCIAAAAVFAAVQSAGADVFIGLDDANHCSGPKVTEDDLAGKVVMIDEWGYMCLPCRMLLPQMQKYWDSFRHKKFVLIGSHVQGRAEAEVQKLVKSNKLTYPIYYDVSVEGAQRGSGPIPYFVVVNHRGRVVYKGRSDREAIEAAQEAMMKVGLPPSLCDGVPLKHFRGMDRQLVLGKAIKNQLKTLEAASKKGLLKSANAADKQKSAEAKAILAAIEASKKDCKREIGYLKRSNPEEALKSMKAYMATFPEEGAAYADELPAMAEKAKKWKEEQKARAAESARTANAKK